MKLCNKCKVIKPLIDFGKERRTKDGLTYYCKQCLAVYVKQYAINHKQARKDRDKVHTERNTLRNRNTFLYKKYGITNKDYEEMFLSQNGLCKLCNREYTTKNYHVDHCHTTGRVRGLLCGPCNTALGLVRENEEVLKNMIKYLLDNK